MAVQYNILERYGIKEVADVVFIDLESQRPVLYLDSLKVSTIEETAENTEARGGKGNAPLLSWDYGKEINVTITDALYSPKSLTLMHSQNLSDLHVYNPDDPAGQKATKGLNVKKYKNLYVDGSGKIEGAPSDASQASAIIDAAISANTNSGAITFLKDIGVDAKEAQKLQNLTSATGAYEWFKIYRAEDNALFGEEVTTKDSKTYTFSSILPGQVYIIEYDVEPAHKSRLEISADAFPGTYKVIGDTYARNNRTGKDQFFQFVINKAKINPETTITLEAEGDPTVFDMSLKVLRPNNGVMMELIQYDFEEVGAEGTGNAVNVHHQALTDLYPDAGTAGADAQS